MMPSRPSASRSWRTFSCTVAQNDASSRCRNAMSVLPAARVAGIVVGNGDQGRCDDEKKDGGRGEQCRPPVAGHGSGLLGLVEDASPGPAARITHAEEG